MTTEQTRQTLQAYAEAMLSFGDYGRYLADDVTMTFMGPDREVSGRANVLGAIKHFHESGVQQRHRTSAAWCAATARRCSKRSSWARTSASSKACRDTEAVRVP